MPDTAVVPPRPMAGSRVSGSRPGGGNLPLLRDPDHYEEINVIGTGNTKFFIVFYFNGTDSKLE